MRAVLSITLALVAAAFLALVSNGGVALASFHCMRIHAVMAGYQGDTSIQYVELRMNTGGQNLVAGHVIEFRDAAGTLKATFTLPGNVTNASTGDSILIATSEFNATVTGGAANFVFSGANTVGANGGDPLHPVQGANGKVTFAPTDANCALQTPVDSVAYGTASATYGTAAVALPGPGTDQALRINNLNMTVSNNSTEYALQPVSTNVYSVPVGSLSGDPNTPRNNSRAVLALSPAAVGGVAVPPDLPAISPASADGGGRGYAIYVLVSIIGAVAVVFGAGWLAYRRRGVSE